MKEDTEDYYSLGSIVNNMRSFLKYLRARWWALLLAMLVGAGLGLVYYFMQKPKYEAVTTFILDDKSSSGGGGLAGLASQFGFSLGGLSGGGSIFSGDNILDILKSKKIVREVLLNKIDSSPGNATLADLYLDFSNLKKKWQKKPRLAGIRFSTNYQPLTPVQDSVLNVIYNEITEKHLSIDRLNKKGSIFKVQVTATNSTFARMMTALLVDAAGKLYMDIRTGTSQSNIRELQTRSDSLLILLNRKSFSAAATQLLDVNPALRTAVVPTEIATRDKTVLATLYAEVTKNLEASKVLLSQQTPVIQVLDKPEYPLVDKKKNMAFLIVVFALGALVLAILLMGLIFLLFSLVR